MKYLKILIAIIILFCHCTATEKEVIYSEEEVEQVPMFSGCEYLPKDEIKNCAQSKMMDFIYMHLRYEPLKEDEHIHTNFVYSFMIEKDGSISNIELIKGNDHQLNTREVLKSMPKWIPGKKDGKPVKVKLSLPLKIKPG